MPTKLMHIIGRRICSSDKSMTLAIEPADRNRRLKLKLDDGQTRQAARKRQGKRHTSHQSRERVSMRPAF
ncbi:uncharacterized protein L969DRAFT_139839 [Mixia osmundae IAM 14324]|uniref:Uncharacterized protein n=1 Tax=Mixia osmundae (strain CBS 9802 / IAM 14324 / JCM 22182 / KY 12970) TaxID=764103 RepID=G7E0B4_MIXOS|nr:uncharacterized protein L969DRAFT_139839 [Mixia osmundae IAM 14324]KEI42265.1 hypothetical protein L969DRAFT_139839 [Mixia osmundae IAM 14324]GAA96274.1 hypothetical protein E5Q_02939 [Mixia osmundae IAM 14324]